ncbi:MAG TPA: type II toxin-antitoxin system RelE/ParE family toxin [Longimicrobium sp.]|nr:type II toxin-antitoxin system RelE/ParE family toxin [Longimicrobium sp.]
MRYRLTRRAGADIRKAEEHFKGEGDEIGRAFAKAMRDALDLITTFPNSSPADAHGIRRKPLTNFSYSFFYYLEEDVVEILSLMHHRRHPDAWRG